MPEALRKALESLSARNASIAWDYLDRNEKAVNEMIKILVDRVRSFDFIQVK